MGFSETCYLYSHEMGRLFLELQCFSSFDHNSAFNILITNCRRVILKTIFEGCIPEPIKKPFNAFQQLVSWKLRKLKNTRRFVMNF